MRTLLALIVGIAVGVAAIWYWQNGHNRAQLESAGAQFSDAARSARTNIEEKLRSLNLQAPQISNELARTGRVIREKAEQAGHSIADATADARVTGAIKGKLLQDSQLSAWDISVNTTDGVVTLSGSVRSAGDIGRAVLLALETDGVRQVISTLQVKPQ